MTLPLWLRGLRQRAHAKDAALHFPVRKTARIAILEAQFRLTTEMRAFSLDDMPWMRAWQPEGLVLPLELALMLADQKHRGLFDLPSLSKAIVVLTSIDDSPLADHHRDLLWHAFRVPIFEQLRALDGHVLAMECEVHDGLHVCSNEAWGIDGKLVVDPCACGLETPRLRSRGPLCSHAVAG